MSSTTRQVIPIAAGVLLLVAACLTFAFVSVHRGHNEPRQTLASNAIQDFSRALEQYRADTGSYPSAVQGLSALRVKPEGVENWRGPYIVHDIHSDPWGHPYLYKYPGDHGPRPDITSYGTDGRPGGTGLDQDIVSWRARQ